MKQLILVLVTFLAVMPSQVEAQNDGQLVGHLKMVYQKWRQAMVRKDARAWTRYTSTVKQIEVRNRIWSEQRKFPSAVFESPLAPPTIAKLKMVSVQVNGRTAKATYFGKVDFGVGGEPTDNLYVISYVNEGEGWRYDGAEFVKLDALPEVRKQLQTGNRDFLKGKDFTPDGILKPAPVAIKGPAKYLTKAYVYCPGREVKLMVNKVSPHLFQNTKRADIVIGGAKDGLNEVQFSIKDIPGGDPKAPITIRIYIGSAKLDKPLKVLQYQIEDGAKPKASGTLNFTVDAAMAKKLAGQ